MTVDDTQLLRQYVEERSEAAFTELVRRHASLVYFAALRRVGGDVHLADDVTQRVFTDLSRKAASLSNRTVLTGWLYTSTRFAAAQAVRTEQRRRTHEQEAHTMHELQSAPEGEWEQLRPIIDTAMDELNDRDREVVLLRFFENQPLAEVGHRFSLSPDAARMRVDRALEKLRALLARRGIASTSTALAAAFATQSGLAAPAGLVGRIVAGVLSQAGQTATATIALWKILTSVVILGLGAGVVAYQVKQSHPPAGPAPSLATGTAPLTAAPALAPAAPTPVPASSDLDGPADKADTVAYPAKALRTPDDFGWPQVGLFAGNAGEKPSHTFADFHAKMQSDPEFRASVETQARNHLDLFYGHLFKSLNLPAVQFDQFKDLLVEKEQLKIDTAEAQQALGLPVQQNRDLFREAVDRNQQNVDAEIKALLGESGNAEYLQYREDLVQWTAVNAIAQRLQTSSTPLTDDQAEKLVVLLRSSLLRIKSPYTFDIGYGAGLFSGHIGSALTERVYEQAAEFLAAPQVAALRQLQKQRGGRLK